MVNAAVPYDSMGDDASVWRAGDSIGVLLDLDEGWMRFYLNGERHGPGFTSDVKGPLVRALHLGGPIGDRVMAVPGAEPPAGCGGEEDVWVWPVEQPEEEEESEREAEA